MGYSNYWERSYQSWDVERLAFDGLVRDCWRLFTYCEHRGLKLAGPLGDGAPELLADRVAFNGPDPLGFETFAFDRSCVWTPEGEWLGCRGYCKTGERPYGAAVVAVLLLAVDRYGSALTVGSDGAAGGQPGPELVRGLELLQGAFPDRRGRYSLAPFLDAVTA